MTMDQKIKYNLTYYFYVLYACMQLETCEQKELCFKLCFLAMYRQPALMPFMSLKMAHNKYQIRAVLVIKHKRISKMYIWLLQIEKADRIALLACRLPAIASFFVIISVSVFDLGNKVLSYCKSKQVTQAATKCKSIGQICIQYSVWLFVLIKMLLFRFLSLKAYSVT